MASSPKKDQEKPRDTNVRNGVPENIWKGSPTKHDGSKIGQRYASVGLEQKKNKLLSAKIRTPSKKASEANPENLEKISTMTNSKSVAKQNQEETTKSAKEHRRLNQEGAQTNKGKSTTKAIDLNAIANKEGMKQNYKQRLQTLSYGFQILSARHPAAEYDSHADYNSNNDTILHNEASLFEALDALDRADQDQKTKSIGQKKLNPGDDAVNNQTKYYDASPLCKREDMRRKHAACIKRITGQSPDFQRSYHHDIHHDRQVLEMYIKTERKTEIPLHSTKMDELPPPIIVKCPSGTNKTKTRSTRRAGTKKTKSRSEKPVRVQPNDLLL